MDFPQTSNTNDSPAPLKSLTHQVLHEKRKNREGEWVTKRSYEIMTKLGKGGFAKVYLAKELASLQQYAIKVIDKASIEKDSYKDKLNQEIRFQKMLNHENVVKYFSSFEDSKNVYIVLEYCSNQTFKELLDRRKRLTEIEAKSHLVQIIASLKYIHSQGIIHRDLKIANIFLNAKMEVKLADFGLSAQLKYPETKRKTVCGTPNYIAPEVLKNFGHDFQVDSWAVGVILYTFLIGKPPFEEKEAENTLKNIKANRYGFPENCSLSKDAIDFIKKILVPNPVERMTIDGMLKHPFLSSNASAIPRTMPISTLALPPTAKFLNSLIPTSEESKVLNNRIMCSTSQNTFKLSPSLQENIPVGLSQSKTQIQLSDHYYSQKGNSGNSTNKPTPLLEKIKSNTNKNEPIPSQLLFAGSTVSVVDSIDLRDKIGVAYYLSNGSIGILLNNGDVIQLSNPNTFEVIQKEPSATRKTFNNVNDIPNDTVDQYKLVLRMKDTFEKRLPKQSPTTSQIEAAAAVSLRKYFTTDKATIFRFSNRNVHAKFVDRSELVISQANKEIYFKDSHFAVTKFSLSENQNLPSDIRRRFDYIKAALSQASIVSPNKQLAATQSTTISSHHSHHPLDLNSPRIHQGIAVQSTGSPRKQPQQLAIVKNSNMTNSLTNISTSTSHQTPLQTAVMYTQSGTNFPSLDIKSSHQPLGTQSVKSTSNMPTPRSRFH